MTLEPLKATIERGGRRPVPAGGFEARPAGLRRRRRDSSRCGRPGQPGDLFGRHDRRRRAGRGVFRPGHRSLSAQARRVAARCRRWSGGAARRSAAGKTASARAESLNSRPAERNRGCAAAQNRYFPPLCQAASRPTRDDCRVIRISIDAMGGDHGPSVVIPGLMKVASGEPTCASSSTARVDEVRPDPGQVPEGRGGQRTRSTATSRCAWTTSRARRCATGAGNRRCGRRSRRSRPARPMPASRPATPAR